MSIGMTRMNTRNGPVSHCPVRQPVGNRKYEHDIVRYSDSEKVNPLALEVLSFDMSTAFCPRLAEKMESLEEAEPH